MKKFLALVLALTFAICLFACGKQKEEPPVQTGGSTSAVTTPDRSTPAATTESAETVTTEEEVTTETTATTTSEWRYQEVPYAEVSYSKLYLNGKEIYYYNILCYSTMSTISPTRSMVRDGEAMFVSKPMLNHDEDIPTYEYKKGDTIEIENCGNSRMKFYAVYSLDGEKIAFDGQTERYPIEKVDELPTGTYYLRFNLTEESNEYLFAGSPYDEGMYYVYTEYFSYIKIVIE